MNPRFAASAMPHPYDSGVDASSFALRPAWGLIGVAAGTISAILLLPEHDYYLGGALIPSGLALSAGLLLGPVLGALRNPLTAFRAEHLLLFGIVYWLLLDTVQGSYRLWGVSGGAVAIAFACIGIFAALLWLGSAATALLVPAHRPEVSTPAEVAPVRADFLFAAGVACFLLGMAEPLATCRLSPGCMTDAFFAPRFETPWGMGEGIRGWNTVLHHLRFFGYLLLPIAAAVLHVERRLGWRGVALGALSALFLLFLLREGGRRSVGTVVGATFLVWMLLQQRPRARHYVALIVSCIGVLVLLQVMLTWRNIGFGALRAERIVQSGAPLIAVDRNFEWLANIIQIVPARHPHTGSTGIRYILLYPIPRSVMPDKPLARGIDLPSYMGRSYRPGHSWTCSAIGDLFLIGGLFAVSLGGLLYGVAANLCSRILRKPRTARSCLVYAAVAMTLFVSLRALHEVMATGFIVLAVLALFMVRDTARAMAAKVSGPTPT